MGSLEGDSSIVVPESGEIRNGNKKIYLHWMREQVKVKATVVGTGTDSFEAYYSIIEGKVHLFVSRTEDAVCREVCGGDEALSDEALPALFCAVSELFC